MDLAAASSDLRAQQRLDAALGHAYRYLNHRDRTVAEIRKKLTEKEVRPGDVEAAVAELCELGYLDDRRYARRFTEDRRELDGWGDVRIELRLAELGIDRDLIAEALAGSDSSRPDPVQAAAALVIRRFGTSPLDPPDLRRALGYLGRKGYTSEQAHAAIRHASTSGS